mmetsp:Transcript_66876/g.105802  ORF Transcript_66876/g.105802 Transcript_66876/m.105802 type:complete len:807 (+) Transcript_66876:95-2515(+)
MRSSSSSTSSYGATDDVKTTKGGLDTDVIDLSKQAVIWVKKASNGSTQWVENCSKEQFEWYMLFKKTKWPNYWAKLILMALAVFELPSTCRGTSSQCAQADMSLYSWNLPVIPLSIRMSIALLLYLAIGARLIVRWKSLGEKFEYRGWTMFQSLCIGIGALFCVFTLIGSKEGSFCWLITILCRPLVLLAGTKKLRNAFTGIVHAVIGKHAEDQDKAKVSVAFVIATLFLSIWVFVWMGMVLFARTPEGRRDFFNWADGCASMWILFTTANDPNDWIPAYTSYRISVIFFIIFLVLMLYLLLNLLLANVYKAYKEHAEAELLEIEYATKLALGEAFQCLAQHEDDAGIKGIEPQAWAAFIADLCDPHIGKIHASDPEERWYNLGRSHKILKAVLNTTMENFDEKERIEYPLFQETVLLITARGMFIPSKKEAPLSCVPLSMTKFFVEGVELFGIHWHWDRIVDFLILMAMPITMWASISFAGVKEAVDFRHFLSFRLLFALSILYALGLSVKILSLRLERFWYRNQTQHRFDFFVVYLLIIAELVYFFAWPTQPLARVIILFHLARGFRLLAYFDALKDLYNIMTLLIPTFWQLFLVLFVIFYLFAVVGQYLFGGLIFTTNPVLAGTNFAQAHFWSLNFNDLLSGFVTLFALMIVNNWYELAQGFMLVTHSNLVSIYFVLFFVVCNLIVLNIVVALVLDCNTALEAMTKRQASHLRRNGDKEIDLEIGEGMGAPSAESVMRRAFNLDAEDPPSDDDTPKPSSSRIDNAQLALLSQKTPRHSIYKTFGEQSKDCSLQYDLRKTMTGE